MSAVTDPLAAEAKSCLVLGVGNLLWADEGLGPRLVALLGARYDIPQADLVDGGTQGLYLLPQITEANHVLVFDAIKVGAAPGTVKVLKDAEIDTVFRGALSLHQTTLHDLLAAAKLINRYPQQVVLIGVEAEETEDWGGGLTPTVQKSLDEALTAAVAVLRGWGLSVTEKPEAATQILPGAA